MATLHLMVGLPCSGKSTLARRLEQEHSALRLTPDEWQIRLFGQDAEEPEHNARHTLIETLQWEVAKRKYDATADTDRQVVERVADIAEKHGAPRVHIALAWLLQKQPVTAPIIGATKISHLEDAVGAKKRFTYRQGHS